MTITPYHTKYYAQNLTIRHSSNNILRLTSVLGGARVDLNPHQVDAALFAFQSPLSKGVILGDEVGLGKTIEAGLIIAQKWAEGVRGIVVICPANLRKQWALELEEKFFLPVIILDTNDFKGDKNPFFNKNTILICSYQLAHAQEKYLSAAPLKLAAIDEAHRLRNVYRSDNRIGNSIKRSLKNVFKLLITATPLQNSTLELYGLVSLIDDYTFGSYESFKAQYSRLDNEASFEALKGRLGSICKRTLRKDVQEYIKYTKRIAIVEEFELTAPETELYHAVNQYLYRERLYALPRSQRHLITLVMRKLLSSSSFAIEGTFNKLIERLEAELKGITYDRDVMDDYDAFAEVNEQWEEYPSEHQSLYDHHDITGIEQELEELREYAQLAKTIRVNAKGEKLITALQKGFDKLSELCAPQKAIIFTESRRTQNYIKQILDRAGYKGRIVLFNGTNNDEESKQIYAEWLTNNQNTGRVSGNKAVDMRQALTDRFRNNAQIMIATEAAAEGLNLQFCSLVVNYDLPWNPQRIEQRIGRCHRYGQLFDVVVINFLNRWNEADQRIYQLLDEKFQLFNGVFGASDEILGKIGEGVDFEKRIGEIFQQCRTSDEINAAFDALQAEYESEIDKTMKNTRKKLLENFDAEVHEKLRISLGKSKAYITKQEQWLWDMTKRYLNSTAHFHDDKLDFRVKNNVLGIPSGHYRLLRFGEPVPIPTEKDIEFGRLNERYRPTDHFDGFFHIYRQQHPLAQQIINHYKDEPLEVCEVTFDSGADKIKRTTVDSLKGRSGYLQLTKLTIDSFERSEYLIFAGMTSSYIPLNQDTCHRLFDLPATVGQSVGLPDMLKRDLEMEARMHKSKIVEQNRENNNTFFTQEMDKLQGWADDMNLNLERELKELETMIRNCSANSKKSSNLDEKIALQRQIKELEVRRNLKRRSLFEAQDEIARQKDELLTEIEQRLAQTISEELIFTIKFKVV